MENIVRKEETAYYKQFLVSPFPSPPPPHFFFFFQKVNREKKHCEKRRNHL